MNNSQAALIAAAAFHAGQQASIQDVKSTASAFESHLREQDVASVIAGATSGG